MSIKIGSSDAPDIVGIGHSSPWQLWARLVGLLPPKEDTPAMEWGRRLERLIVERIAEDVGAESVQDGYPLARDERPWQRATPDALLYLERGEPWLAEAKALRGQVPEEPLLAWLVQCQHQLMVWPDFRGVALGAFGALDFRCWRVTPHADLQRTLLVREEAFLKLVETETPPPVEAADNAWLAKAYPLSDTLKAVKLGTEALEWDSERQAGKEQEKNGKRRADAAEANLKFAMGDARTAVLPSGISYTWAPTKRKGYTVEESTVRTLRRKGAKGNGDD